MAKLSAFRVNSKAVTEGEWVRIGDEYDDLEIKTRGRTDQYHDATARRQRKAAAGFGGDVTKLPLAIRREINVECLIEFVVLDVRNLLDDAGEPVTLDQFRALLRDPDYKELVEACYIAAEMVGQRRAAEAEEARGN